MLQWLFDKWMRLAAGKTAKELLMPVSGRNDYLLLNIIFNRRIRKVICLC